VSSDLAPFIVMLRTVGLKSARRVVWKRAHTDAATGLDFDLDSHLAMVPSRVTIEKDATGKITKAVFPSQNSSDRFVRQSSTLKYKVSKFGIPPITSWSNKTLTFTIGRELQRLAMKMSVAVAEISGHRKDIFDADARSFLLTGHSLQQHAGIDFSTYSILEASKPALAHMIYVKGNADTGRCYSIVQLFGTIQLYVILNHSSYGGETFAAFAVYDVVTKKETFRDAELFRFPAPPVHIPDQIYEEGLRKWGRELTRQVAAALGRDLRVELNRT
jgi:hypothetical protein